MRFLEAVPCSILPSHIQAAAHWWPFDATPVHDAAGPVRNSMEYSGLLKEGTSHGQHTTTAIWV